VARIRQSFHGIFTSREGSATVEIVKRRWPPAGSGLAVTLCAGLAARGEAGTTAAENPPHRLTTAVDAGRSARLDTPHGAVHVWAPAGYHPDGAATIVYVHGYHVNVDGAWTAYQLPEQFALSAIDAVFIAIEAPSGPAAKPSWTDLDELLATVFAETGIVRPLGPLIAVGHSGAYRTLETWLGDPMLDELALVDADYDATEPFEAWLRASPRHRILDVTEDTVQWSEQMLRDTADLAPVLIDRFPSDPHEWPAEVRTARLVTIRAPWRHMQLVTNGIVLPMLFRLFPVPELADAPWDAPLGDLPPVPPEARP
jgi:hypothetical protein